MTYQLHHGNMLDILPMMERDGIDAIVTDPPYGLGFMGKDWDHGVPGEHFWREAYRVAKPGAHLLAFGGTRTFHRLACAIEDAGWEIRDTVMWVYGQGFPKSHDVSKAIDREAGAEREIIETREYRSALNSSGTHQAFEGVTHSAPMDITQPATPAAAEWDGWGTALKPAWEPILVARKPLAGTVVENVQRYGCGAINVDACRIEHDSKSAAWVARWLGDDGHPDESPTHGRGIGNQFGGSSQGRWPANLIHDGSAEVLAGFPQTSSHGGGQSSFGGVFGNGKPAAQTVADTGSAARFFYCAKASKQDRDEGCEEFDAVAAGGMDGRNDGSMGSITMSRNHHPTVKPTALMRYLCRLVTPPQGVILDPFMGSGSTGKAAILEGFNFVGVELEREYLEIAARRIEHACGKVGIVVEQPMMIESRREVADKSKQLILL